MSYIERVDIAGFWGDRQLTFKLFEDVNFLIGPNGSGKTTAINTIAAALTGDFANLDKLPFRSISITLHDPATRRKPSVEVRKVERDRSPYPSITYSIRDRATGEPTEYSLDELEEERLYRGAPHSMWYRLRRHGHPDVSQRLRDLAPTTLLSIHRATGRSALGLSNLHLFIGVDLIVFTEGGPRTSSKSDAERGKYETNAMDIVFWREIFRQARGELKVEFRALGSKSTLKNIAQDIAEGKVARVCGAMDRDYDGYFARVDRRAGVLYTRGYSWENDCFHAGVVEELFYEITQVDRQAVSVRGEIQSIMRRAVSDCSGLFVQTRYSTRLGNRSLTVVARTALWRVKCRRLDEVGCWESCGRSGRDWESFI